MPIRPGASSPSLSAIEDRPDHPLNGSEIHEDDRNVWVVVAAFNEATRLGNVLASLVRRNVNVVVVDDGSSDATTDVARQHPVWIVRHSVNCGQGAALKTGLDFALSRGARWLVTFDADGQHAADQLDRLLAPLRSGEADVALGSRFLGEAVDLPLARRLVLKGAVLFTRIVSRIRVTDAHNGFRAFSRHAAERIRITQNRMAHASEILDEIRFHGLTFREVPVTIRYSTETLAKGQSSWNALRISAQLLLGRLIR